MSKEFPGADLDALAAQAAGREPSSVTTYPLHARGERFPFIAPEAGGFTLGTPADEGDRYAGVLQGVAFIERLCFDYLDMLGAPVDGPKVLTGGGAKSRYWCQLRADVLGSPVNVPIVADIHFHYRRGIEAAQAGAACLRINPGNIGSEVRVREVIDPRPGRTAVFHEPYLKLVDELTRRGWLPEAVAQHAHRRAAR